MSMVSVVAAGFIVAFGGWFWFARIEANNEPDLGGKRSERHKATVVSDAVGDPFKDTTGPSLNIIIKLMSMVSVVAAGFIVAFGGWF